ncbi:MAG: hydroxyethylthiazole kinase [Rhodobacteraceae bacterium]|nr:hydroxyethylthiazole kinase [Paracoccaceae bacterium]
MAVRKAEPLVQNITNYVAMNVMANVLLSAGASPAMVHARDEGAEFARIADALTINIGTLDQEWLECMALAAASAKEHGTPWVLDPVAVGATELRQKAGERLLGIGPTVIRGNASEILALAGRLAGGHGVDATDAVSDAEAAARDLASRSGAVVAVSGAEDFVTDGKQAKRITNGDPIMARVTALGCSLTGIIGAFLPTGSAFDATVAGMTYFAVAGEAAAQRSKGPGRFQVCLLDALSAISGETLDTMACVTRV